MRPSKYLVLLFGIGIVFAVLGLFNPLLFYLQSAYNLSVLSLILIDLVFGLRFKLDIINRSIAEKQELRLPSRVLIHLKNRSAVRIKYEIKDHIPLEFITNQASLSGEIKPYQSDVINYAIIPSKRGEYKWGKSYLRYRSLLNLWLFYKEFSFSNTVKVYPNLQNVSRYYLLSRIDKLSEMGIRKIRLKGLSREFESLRDYVRGDDIRDIDWKSTAHRQKLTVKNYENEKNQRVILAIDTGRLMSSTVAGISKLDYTINSALILASVAILRNDRVGVCLFSNQVHLFLPPEKTKRHIHKITEALYNADYDYYETNHARCLNYLAIKHKKRSLIIMLSDFADIDTSEEMLRSITSSARHNLFIYVGIKDPFIQLTARQIPKDTILAYHKAVAIELENDRFKVLETLKRQGVHTLDCRPDQITAPMINKYLELSHLGAL